MTRNGSNSCDHTLKRRQYKIRERGLFSSILINSSEISSLNQFCETVTKVPLWLIPTQSGKVLISILQVNIVFENYRHKYNVAKPGCFSAQPFLVLFYYYGKVQTYTKAEQ